MVQSIPIRIRTTNRVLTKFNTARGVAIASYANLEHCLVAWFAHLMDAEISYAGVPFFGINNARGRNIMLGRLLRKRYGSKYNLFWNPLEKELNSHAQVRNEIVHWTVLSVVNHLGKLTNVKLIPPNYWDRDANSPKKTIAEMDDFSAQSRYLMRAVDMLHYVASGRKPEQPAWNEICVRAIPDPLPSSHLLSRSATEPKILRRAFPR
jgi:hypothetical protein